MTIPNNPTLNEEWTNDATGITYKWDGQRWLIVEEPIDLSGYVTDAEFETDQQRQDDVVTAAQSVQDGIQDEQVVQNSQINALETQIQLLSGVKAVGKWTYRRRVESNAPRPPATSTFYGTHKDGASNVLLSWSDTYLLMINKTDIDGNNYTFSDFEEGDKVEIIATDGSSAVYGTITNNPSNDVYGNMIIDVERFRSGPVEEKEYLISAYRPGSSNDLIDLDILDQRYLVKTGDTMTGNLVLDGAGLYTDSIIKSTRNTGYAFQAKPDDADVTAFVHTNGNAKFADVKVDAAPLDGSDLTNKDYVDTEITTTKEYVDAADGILGQMITLNGQEIAKKVEKAGDTMTGDLAMDGNKITGLGTPTANAQAANKGYVDQQIAQINSPNIIVPGSAERPPGLRFSFVSGSSVTNGKFAWYTDSGRKLKISATSYDFPWGTDSPTGDITYSEAHLFHIYATVVDSNTGNERWRIKTTGSFNRLDWHTNHILLYVPYHLMNGSFSESAAYYITISGLF